MNEVLFTLLGLLVGAAIVLVVVSLRRKPEPEDAEPLIEQLKVGFAALSREALTQNTDDFLKLAKTRLETQTVEGEKTLEAKKQLIDARLEEMGTKLKDLNKLIEGVEKHRAESQGSLRTQIAEATQATNRLQKTTGQLSEALASTKRRGQWGERMAEDVLQLAGFVDGVNYRKQQQLGGGTQPDFTFLLPGERVLHMDVKFPLDNYMKTLDAPDDAAREQYTKLFLRDVRMRIKEVTTREYIDPSAGTLDYVLVFIPIEQVYGFIHEQDATMLDDALRKKVVLCSPLTLYAILAVIRQGIENFRIEQSARQVLELLEAFKKEWGKYAEMMDKMGDRLEKAMECYQDLKGVRTRQLERQLEKIDDVRSARETQPTLSDSPGEGQPDGVARASEA